MGEVEFSALSELDETIGMEKVVGGAEGEEETEVELVELVGKEEAEEEGETDGETEGEDGEESEVED